MKKNIVIIGGGPAGIITALTAKSVNPAKSVCVVKDIGAGVIPCAIPYTVSTIDNPRLNSASDQPLINAGIEILVDKAISLDIDSATVSLASGKDLSYDRLVLATGITPALPPVPGADTAGVYTIEKSLSSISMFKEKAHSAKNIVILGGGFIGAEFAEELSKGTGATVNVVEMMPKILYTAFDDEYCDIAGEQLSNLGVNLKLGIRATAIEGNGKVEAVTLDNGETLPADLVLAGVGGRPNIEIAKSAGLKISDRGSIWVDSYMRTSAHNVFAVGDCSLKRDFFTRQEVPVWLASTATSEARIAGTNLFQIRVLRQIQGTIAAFSTKLGDVCFASAGLTCRACDREGFRHVTGFSEAPDRHPGCLPGASAMKVKLVFADRAGTLMGGQICGGTSVGELVNAIAVGIQKQLNVRELDMMQIATHPLLTSAPTVHPFIESAHMALRKLREKS